MADQKKILLVEDDMFLRELCVVKLEKSKYDVDFAANGKEGLELMISGDYDVVLLDIMLPEMDGFEILEEYNKNPRPVKPIIIMLTNLSERDQVDKALTSGADDYIIKAHFSPSEIVQKVEEWLSKKA
jgi:DNA-binding response OmpR family regulator